jgi:hypothetical protein
MTPLTDEELALLKHAEHLWHATEQALGISTFCIWILTQQRDLNRRSSCEIIATLKAKTQGEL